MREKHVAVYVRVSRSNQKLENQIPDIERWLNVFAADEDVVWYRDLGCSGTNFDRPQWRVLEAAMDRGQVSKVVVWRLDRLGRNTRSMLKLFDFLRERHINFVSLAENIDLESASGRFMLTTLCSVATYESEIRSERIKAGLARALAERGSLKQHKKRTTSPRKTSKETIERIKALVESGKFSISRIAAMEGVKNHSIYKMIREFEWDYQYKNPELVSGTPEQLRRKELARQTAKENAERRKLTEKRLFARNLSSALRDAFIRLKEEGPPGA